jgi:putative transposase
MESFFGSLKQEWVYPRTFHSCQEARTEIFYYIEAFYNQRRLHSALDYCSPVEYEQRYYQELCQPYKTHTPCTLQIIYPLRAETSSH